MSARAQDLGAPALPQVNLLPPEVTAARGLARIKRWLVLVVLVALLAAVGIVALAMMAEQDANTELDREEQRTLDLRAEQAQYAEVPLVLDALRQAETARRIAMSTEVYWRPYFEAIAATAPEGVSIENVQLDSATPMQLHPPSADVLAGPAIGTITFTAQSETMPDLEAWVIALQGIPGFADPWFSQALVGETDGVVAYTVHATVQVTELALAERFDAVAEEEE